MSAKFLSTLFSEENTEIQKQIGCMTGIFQMFDRQHLLTSSRRNSHKRHPLDYALSTSGADHGVGSPQPVLEKKFSKSSNENQRVSMESSRTSFSTSSCSSFSSVECSKSTPQESVSYERSGFHEKSSKNLPKMKTPNVNGRPPRHELPNASLQTARRSLDFQEVVKDSINRDSRGLYVKASTKEEVMSHVLKPRDSPRPMQLSKSMDGSYVIGINGKSREAMDLNESLRVLVKMKDAPWNFSEVGGESPRASYEAPKAHRFSYDGKEISRQSLDSQENNNSKFPAKLPELPRLSFDSREGYMRNSSFNLNPDSTLKNLGGSGNNLRIPTSSKSSVVAKLMGLEAMPSLKMSSEDCDNSNKHDLLSRSPRVCVENPTITRVKNPDSIKKQTPISRVPIETAPWKQQQEKQRRVPEKTKVIHREESVYSEIEKRLKELEFRQSNKDLRALKQILDAMHAKGLLETRNSDRTTGENQKIIMPSASPNRMKESRTPRSYESPIVIMKPAKSVKRSGVATTSVLLVDKRNAPSINRLKEANKRIEEDGPNKVRSRTIENGGSSLSPRLQQKIESERLQRPSSSSGRKPIKSVSPRSKLRQRQPQVQNCDEQISENSETRNSSYMGDEISQRSDSNISLASRADVEVTSADQSGDMNSRSPSGRAARKADSVIRQKKKHSTSSSGEVSTVEPVIDAHNYFPSSSPLKKRSHTPKGEKKQTGSIDSQTQTSSSEINQKKLQSIENLVQKLRELTSTEDNDDKLAPTDHIASLCETGTPDHRYVSEILLASGLLMKDLTAGPMGPKPIQLHPSGHPINPDLFLVLEQTKTIKDNAKHHRKLVFDVVNDILIKKLELTSYRPHPEYLFRARTLAGRFPSGQKLLKEVCLEIERFQTQNFDVQIKISDEEILRQSEGWADFGDVPGVVLEIERLIFKDLIGEVVNGEVVYTSVSKTSRRRKQLFSKK